MLYNQVSSWLFGVLVVAFCVWYVMADSDTHETERKPTTPSVAVASMADGGTPETERKPMWLSVAGTCCGLFIVVPFLCVVWGLVMGQLFPRTGMILMWEPTCSTPTHTLPVDVFRVEARAVRMPVAMDVASNGALRCANSTCAYLQLKVGDVSGSTLASWRFGPKLATWIQQNTSPTLCGQAPLAMFSTAVMDAVKKAIPGKDYSRVKRILAGDATPPTNQDPLSRFLQSLMKSDEKLEAGEQITTALWMTIQLDSMIDNNMLQTNQCLSTISFPARAIMYREESTPGSDHTEDVQHLKITVNMASDICATGLGTATFLQSSNWAQGLWMVLFPYALCAYMLNLIRKWRG